MYCNACGKAIAEDGRFCSYCGNVVGIPPTPKKLMRSRARTERSEAFVPGWLIISISTCRSCASCGSSSRSPAESSQGSWRTCSDGSSFQKNRFYCQRQPSQQPVTS